MKWSGDQLKAINNDGSMVVSASAGSGKTTVMIERVLKMLREGRDIERLLVLTFTNAAAADMRDKLSRCLAKEMQGGAGETAERLAAQFNNLQSSKVCTLHSFCMELCRRFFYHLGIPGDVLPMTEAQAKPAAFALIEQMTEEKLYTDEDFTALYFALHSGREDRQFKEAVWQLNVYAGKEEFPEKWLCNAARAYANPELAADFNRKWLDDRAAELAEELFGCRAACGGDPRVEEMISEMREAVSLKTKYGKKMDKRSYKGVDEVLFETLKSMRDKINKLAEDADKYLKYGDLTEKLAQANALAGFTSEFRTRFQTLKEQEGALEFSDFEHLAYRLLSERVYSAPEEYDAVFVDEYQDISPIQDCLIAALTGEKDSFFVGDVKQSIYGFRLCRPEIFAGRFKKRESERRENAILLNENYRSNAKILEFCNAVFCGLMTDCFGGVDYAAEAMLAAGLNAGKEPDFLGIKTILIERPHRDVAAVPDKVYSVSEHVFFQEEIQKAQSEAEICAREIERLLGSRYFDGEVSRNVAYGDFAVLARTKAAVAAVAAVLARRGIPCRAENKDSAGAGRGRELELINNYLRLIDNYRQDLPLISVMKSRLYGFTDAELLSIRKSRPGYDYFYKCVYSLSHGEGSVPDDSMSAGLTKRLRELFNDLKRYGQMSLALTAAELASVIADEKEYFKLLAGEPDGDGKQRNLERYLAFLESKNMPLGIPPFLEFLERAEEEVFAPAAVPVGGDFVRVMTIHGSKGLEFPIVLLTQLNRRRPAEQKQIAADRELGIGISITGGEGSGESDIVRDTILRKEDLRDSEEELRIFYVALTRAKSGLIMIGTETADGKPEGYCKWISAAGVDAVTVPSPAESGGSLKPRPVLPELGGGLDEAFERRRNAVYGHGQSHLSKTNVTKLTEAAQAGRDYSFPVFDIGEREDADGERALLRGNAYHKYLEAYDFSSDPAEFLARITGSVLTLEEAACIDAGKISILNKDDGFKAILARASHIYREKKFVLSLPAHEVFPGGSDDAVLIQGVIDFLAVGAQGAEIVDYKTTKAEEDKLKELYSPQLDLYAKAVEKILKTTVFSKNIYSLYIDKLINIS